MRFWSVSFVRIKGRVATVNDEATRTQEIFSGMFLLVKQHFNENNVDEKCQDLIMDVLSTDGANGNPLETEYQQQKYFK